MVPIAAHRTAVNCVLPHRTSRLLGASNGSLVGVEASRLFMGMDIAYSNLATNPYAIDIYEPVYGQAKPPVSPNISTRKNQRNVGAYLQDEVSRGERWKLLAGVRFDNYH